MRFRELYAPMADRSLGKNEKEYFNYINIILSIAQAFIKTENIIHISPFGVLSRYANKFDKG